MTEQRSDTDRMNKLAGIYSTDNDFEISFRQVEEIWKAGYLAARAHPDEATMGLVGGRLISLCKSCGEPDTREVLKKPFWQRVLRRGK